MVKCFYALDHGISVVIFPEGTIPKKGNKGNGEIEEIKRTGEIEGIGGKEEIQAAEMIPFKDIGRLKKEVFEIIEKQLSYEYTNS